MTYQKVLKKSTRTYHQMHKGKTPIEIDFYKTYLKYPTERELAQFKNWYDSKHKVERIWDI